MSPLRLLRSTCAAAAIGCLAVAAGAPAGPPGMWFWGTGSDVSTSAIKSFTSGLGARAPQIHYSIGGCSMTATSMECTKLNLTMVKAMQAMNMKVHIIIGQTNITTLRTVFAQPSDFILSATKAAAAAGFDGYNLDWEPYQKGMTKYTKGDSGDITNSDGLAYARFLDRFAKALHPHIELSMDYFTDLAVWNLPAMNSTAVDTFCNMDAYVQDNQTEQAYMQMSATYLESARIGIGVCPQPAKPPLQPYGPDPCGTVEWTAAMVAERLGYFQTLLANPRTAFRMMNMCCSGILTDTWWAGLKAFYGAL